MSQSSGPGKWVFRIVLALALVALAQYTLLTVQIWGAKADFDRLGPELRSLGEKRYKERVAEVLKLDHFEVDPKKVSITVNREGTATIHLEASREAKILFFTVHRDVVFHTEPLYDPSL